MLVEALFRRVFKSGEVELIDPSGRRTRYGSASWSPRRRPPARLMRSAAGWSSIPPWRWAKATWTGASESAGGRHLRLPASCSRQSAERPAWAGALHPWTVPLERLDAPLPSAQRPGEVRAATSPTTTTFPGDLYGAVPGQRAPIHLRLSSRPAREDLETAQRLKERHIAAKLRLEPGMRVLDLGCGWGSLAIYLARRHDVDVTGVTLSREQVEWGNARAAELGLGKPRAPAAPRLSRDRGPVRSRGLDRHARACRAWRATTRCSRRIKERLLAGRRGAGPFDRAHGRPKLHQCLDPQVHLPRRLHPGPVRGAAGHRAQRAVGHRHRDPAPALCAHAAPVARAVRRQLGQGGKPLRRALLPDVGILSRGVGGVLPGAGRHELPDPARPGQAHAAAGARLHDRRGAPGWRRRRARQRREPRRSRSP